MKGGYRPGAGRKKGQKDTKPRKGTEARAEAEKVKAVVALAQKAKLRMYQEFLIRVANQDKKQKPLSLAEKRMMNQLGAELAAETGEGKPKGKHEKLDPLEYGIEIMSDPNESSERRDRMAIAILPYLYPRKGEAGTGKKDEKAERARAAASGKFAPGRAPLKVVK